MPHNIFNISTNSQFELVHAFGRNADIDSGANEDLWDGGGLYAFYPSTAESLEVFSGSSIDTTTSSGTATVTVFGLGGTGWTEQSETVTLAGTGAVALSNTYTRIHKIHAETGGSNVGAIDVRIASTDQTGTLAARITAGMGHTMMAIYTIPGDKQAYMKEGDIQVGRGKDVTGFMFARELGSVWQVYDVVEAYEGDVHFNQIAGIKLTGKTDLRIEMASSNNNTDAGGGFSLWLY